MKGRPQGPMARDTPPALTELTRGLRELRSEQMPMRKLAIFAGTSAGTVSRIFTGQVLPSWDLLHRIVEVCGGDQVRFRELWTAARYEQDEGRGRPGRLAERLAGVEGLVQELQERIRRLEVLTIEERNVPRETSPVALTEEQSRDLLDQKNYDPVAPWPGH